MNLQPPNQKSHMLLTEPASHTSWGLVTEQADLLPSALGHPPNLSSLWSKGGNGLSLCTLDEMGTICVPSGGLLTGLNRAHVETSSIYLRQSVPGGFFSSLCTLLFSHTIVFLPSQSHKLTSLPFFCSFFSHYFTCVLLISYFSL